MRGNFDYTSDPTVMNIIDHAARRVYQKFDGKYGSREDLSQDAYVLVATQANLQSAIGDEEYGLLQHRLEQDLTNEVMKEVRRDEKEISYEMLREANADGTGGDDYVKPYVIVETFSNDYTRDSVETLLPAVWDDSYAYGVPQKDTVPDPDMPKAQVDASRGNNLSAYIADIRFGWKKSPLTLKERRALLLAFGLGWTLDEIAYNQGVTNHSVIQRRIESAVGKIETRLNGGYRYDPESG